jgi:hypothetical protein
MSKKYECNCQWGVHHDGPCLTCVIERIIERKVDEILTRKCDELKITEGIDLDGLG